jgi:hypothetical protein
MSQKAQQEETCILTFHQMAQKVNKKVYRLQIFWSPICLVLTPAIDQFSYNVVVGGGVVVVGVVGVVYNVVLRFGFVLDSSLFII